MEEEERWLNVVGEGKKKDGSCCGGGSGLGGGESAAGGVGGLWAVGTWVWVCGAAALV